MEKPVLIIEAPILTNEAVASVLEFLHEVITAFEAHYYHQLQQHHRSLSRCCVPDINSDQDPF